MFAKLLLVLTVFTCNASHKHVIGTHGGNGLFSIFLGALNNIYWADRNGKAPVISWKENNLYYQPQGFNGADEPWEYYFLPVSYHAQACDDPVYRSYSAPDGFAIPYTNYDDAFNRELKFILNKLIDKYIQVRPEVMTLVNNFYAEHMLGSVTIGVHLRGTDKKYEIKQVDPVMLCKAALEISQQHPESKFLVATDDERLLSVARQHFGDRMIAYDVKRSNDGNPVHYTPDRKPQANPAVLGQEVLIEALLLSRCDYFVHTISNVATAVMLFNPWLHTKLLTAGCMVTRGFRGQALACVPARTALSVCAAR